jgi:medium-chain acyl-[acyl-carrier-protein] hydrolase
MLSTRTPGPWWIVPRPNCDAKIRFFCFPYAGGHASLYHSWARAMPEFVEVYALQPPGRANRIAEPPISSVPEFMDRLGPALEPFTDKPFVFFGHSMGSILGFETCLWLRRHGLKLPRRLFVSARRAPHIIDPDNIHTKSDGEFLREIAKLKGTPASVLHNQALLRLLLPSLRSDFRLCETYRYVQDSPLPVPITAFAGLGDKETGQGRLEAWQKHTSARFTSHEIPGDHFFIHSQEEMLFSFIRPYLSELTASSCLVQ